jgi:anti-sigma factor ChrR (cupin superfamily)
MNLELACAKRQKTTTIIGTQKDIVEAIKFYRTKINRLAHRTSIQVDDTKIDIYDDEWTVIAPGVKAMECSITGQCTDSTVVNMQVSEGFLAPHTHDRVEKIYVLEGEYTDTVTGNIYKEGEVQIISPNTLHGLESKRCVLTVSWRPAYERTVHNDE